MSSSRQAPSARQFFSRPGTLSKWHPNYEFRPGQLEMAEAVEAALAEGKHLIVEAGTGTGKTLAYLVPAILSARAWWSPPAPRTCRSSSSSRTFRSCSGTSPRPCASAT